MVVKCNSLGVFDKGGGLSIKYVGDIRNKSSFLEEKGFSMINIDEYIIEYAYKNTCLIEIYYGRYSDTADVCIRFENSELSRPEQYSLGWIRNMIRFETGEKDIFGKFGETANKLANIISLLEFLNDNFDNATNIEFCRKIQRKINKNFEKGVW